MAKRKRKKNERHVAAKELPAVVMTITRPVVAVLVIAVVIAIVYSNCYRVPFTFDDRTSIVENMKNQDPSNFTSFEGLFHIRYLVDLTFALNCWLWGLKPLWFHVVNVIIHIINAVMIYFLCLVLLKHLSSLPRPTISLTALFSALIFAAHPLQTQAVTYIVQRYASMVTMFYLASVCFYIKSRLVFRARQRQEIINGFFSLPAVLFFLSILCGILAIWSKANAATLPGAVMLTEYLLFEKTWRYWKKKLWWFGLACILWAIFILTMAGLFNKMGVSDSLLEDVSSMARMQTRVSRWRYLCTQFNVLAIYLRMLVLPVGQNLDHMYRFKKGFFDGLTPLAFLLVASLPITAIIVRKKHPVVTFGIGWFFITHAIESSIIPIVDAMFEHRMYLPMLGVVLALSYSLTVAAIRSSKRHWRPWIPATLAAAVIVAFSAATFARNMVWRDSTRLWSDVIEKSPHNHRAYYNLGLAFSKRGDIVKSASLYKRAIEEKPGFAEAHYNLGQLLEGEGDVEKTIALYKKAISLNSKYKEAYNNLANLYRELGRPREAIPIYLKVLELEPDYAKALHNLGLSYADTGQPDKAIDCYEKAIRHGFTTAEAFVNLGVARYGKGETEKAVELYMKAIDENPEYADSYSNLGVARFNQGKTDEALELFKKAVTLKPTYTTAYNNIVALLYRKKAFTEAVEYCRRAEEAGVIIKADTLKLLERYMK